MASSVCTRGAVRSVTTRSSSENSKCSRHMAVRNHEIILDVESPTQWDVETAELGLRRLAEALAMVRADSGDHAKTVTVHGDIPGTLRR